MHSSQSRLLRNLEHSYSLLFNHHCAFVHHKHYTLSLCLQNVLDESPQYIKSVFLTLGAHAQRGLLCCRVSVCQQGISLHEQSTAPQTTPRSYSASDKRKKYAGFSRNCCDQELWGENKVNESITSGNVEHCWRAGATQLPAMFGLHNVPSAHSFPFVKQDRSTCRRYMRIVYWQNGEPVSRTVLTLRFQLVSRG